MVHIQINANYALATSIVLYPLIFRLITPLNASPSRFALSREAISVAHCMLITVASALELYRQYDRWVPPASYKTSTPTSGDLGSTKETRLSYSGLKIIDTRSCIGNAIVAYECGYLLQDAVVLILGGRRAPGDTRSRSIMAKNINWRVLGWHHFGLTVALGWFHLKALRGEAKGILLVLMLFLMNISTPFGTLHWFLVKFRQSSRTTILISHLMYLLVYSFGRVYLVYWILQVFGSWTGRSAIGAFASLPKPCQLGTGVIGVANSLWLLIGYRKFFRRYLIRIEGKRGQ